MLGFLIPLVIVAGLIWLYFLYDRRRYQGKRAPGQRPTGEVFRDPATGRTTRVYEDPETGTREYRQE